MREVPPRTAPYEFLLALDAALRPLADAAEIMATASLARKETRTGSSHWRLDYPETDEKNWRQFVVVRRGEQGAAVQTLSTDQPLSAAFGRAAALA